MTARSADSDAEPINSYDLVPYEGRPFPETHPGNIATIALLLGMNPEPIECCRVLELGCSTAGNLIPMAVNLPESQFLGIDFSAREIQLGQEHVKELGLKNIELRQMNILDLDESLGQFHYIIVHGVFSWVPEAVRQKILACCRELLSPNGVAYVSYNTYPGWHFSGIAREVMLYHSNLFHEPEMRCRQARAILDFIAESVPAENDGYGALLKAERDYAKNRSDDYIIHEYLADHNDPLYFWQFEEQLAAHELQYLGDAEYGLMLTSTLNENAHKLISPFSDLFLQKEQYIDFVRNRAFRRTLLCRDNVALNRNPDYRSLRSLFVACPARAVEASVRVNSGDLLTFRLEDGSFYYSSVPLVKAAFQHLEAIYPNAVRFDELVKIARNELPSDLIRYRGSLESNAKLLGEAILTAYAYEVLTLRSYPAHVCSELSGCPAASDLARYQAKQQRWVTTQLHEVFYLDAFERQLLPLLDGSRNRSQLLDDLLALVQIGKLSAEDIGTVDQDRSLKERLEEKLDSKLSIFLRAGLFLY